MSRSSQPTIWSRTHTTVACAQGVVPRNDDDEEDSSMGDYGKEDTEQTEQDEERVCL